LPDEQGVIIRDVLPDGPAGEAGIKEYDIVIAAGDKPITEPDDLAQAVHDSNGDELQLRLLRGGKEITVAATPGPRPREASAASPGRRPRRADWDELIERLRRGGPGANPWAMQFLQPGVILPPGDPLHAPLPDDMSVTISKQGDASAKILVEQGDQRWEVTDRTLDKLPDNVREHVERMLGRVPLGIRLMPGARVRPNPNSAPPAGFDFDLNLGENRELSKRLERQLNEMSEQLENLRDSVEKLQRDRVKTEPKERE
jgi:hypothetical protein